MRTDLFDFDLPEDRIALRPAEPRDSARLLVVAPAVAGHRLEHRTVRDLPALLRAGDALVVNDTRVIPAALEGSRTRDGATARIAINLIRRLDDSTWRAFARPAKRLAVGDRIVFRGEGDACALHALAARVAERGDAGEVTLAFEIAGPYLDDAIRAHGSMPLPPYIALKRGADATDEASYQTMFASRDGAVAAPTAGLHFTPRLLDELAQRGIARHTLTLHVGAGTFLPVKADDTSGHKMHSEWGEIDRATADALNAVHRNGGRIVCAGTTTLRVLESAALPDGTIMPFRGETDIFITPGYQFRACDVLLTNFHLPRSTLFMLVSAFCGLDTMKAAYAEAIASGYRFYSYGDACLLFRKPA